MHEKLHAIVDELEELLNEPPRATTHYMTAKLRGIATQLKELANDQAVHVEV